MIAEPVVQIEAEEGDCKLAQSIVFGFVKVTDPTFVFEHDIPMGLA